MNGLVLYSAAAILAVFINSFLLKGTFAGAIGIYAGFAFIVFAIRSRKFKRN